MHKFKNRKGGLWTLINKSNLRFLNIWHCINEYFQIYSGTDERL